MDVILNPYVQYIQNSGWNNGCSIDIAISGTLNTVLEMMSFYITMWDTLITAFEKVGVLLISLC